ncbi:exocyst complex subunit 6 [Heterostelium album PN500]|uniref:Exocyst complex subunit 6 n=1 Tax=Heterostelium pallidum (strain ATCC 26659 / Pp 5 / PN500) TaxID=670386 RepID=D3B4S5_HETP5|nr:exocyst complex subunit 6 [Heterostelium album PN500]EFA84323.1 exocyst complex subunit 6 [Heterostelium album PN500]|eukprot:XP_020436438.1 exocyst complex subunit 6 [Heterostelium album PN500]
MSQDKKQITFFQSSLIGGTAGCIAKTIAAPFENARNWVKLPLNHNKSFSEYLIRVIKDEGVLIFWKGNLRSVIKYFPLQSLNFSFNEEYKRLFVGGCSPKQEPVKFFIGSLMAGGAAGATSMLFVYPMEYARFSLAVDTYTVIPSKFKGLGNCISYIYKNEGVRAFYRGFGLSATSGFVYRATFFGGYDSAKELLLSDPKNANILQSWAIAQVVTTVAGIASYPFDMVRRRMQMQSYRKDNRYTGAVDCYKKIVKNEGASTLFRGAFTNSIRNSGAALALMSSKSKDKDGVVKTPSKSDKDIKKEKKEKEKEDKERERKERKEKEKQERRAVKEARAKAKSDKKASKKAGRDRSGSDVSVDDYTSDTDTDQSSDLTSSLGSSRNNNNGDLDSLLGTSGGGNNNNSNNSQRETVNSTNSGIGLLSNSNKKNEEQKERERSDKAKEMYDGVDLFTSENFLIALADTDHLGPAIKSMFESNKEKEVIDSLNEYIQSKDKDIEKICGDNHEGFINSVTTFLGLKEDNLTLKQSIIHLNYELQELGTKYTNKADEMLAHKRTKDNIRGTKEIINNCQYAIQLGMKVEEFVKNKRYFLAIKNMDQLHNVYLKRLSDFQFARNMDSNIPVIKEKIKKLVKDEFNSWMVEIKEKSAKIGRFGMIQSAKRLEKEREINPLKIKTMFGENEEVWDRILDIPYNVNTSAIGSLSSTQTPLSPSFVSVTDTSKEDISQKSPFDEVDINFHPLYQYGCSAKGVWSGVGVVPSADCRLFHGGEQGDGIDTSTSLKDNHQRMLEYGAGKDHLGTPRVVYALPRHTLTHLLQEVRSGVHQHPLVLLVSRATTALPARHHEGALLPIRDSRRCRAVHTHSRVRVECQSLRGDRR